MELFVISGDLLRRHPVLGVVSKFYFWTIWAEHLKLIRTPFIFKKIFHVTPTNFDMTVTVITCGYHVFLHSISNGMFEH